MTTETANLAANLGRKHASGGIPRQPLPEGEFRRAYLASYARTIAEFRPLPPESKLPPRDYPRYNQRGQARPDGRVFRTSAARV